MLLAFYNNYHFRFYFKVNVYENCWLFSKMALNPSEGNTITKNKGNFLVLFCKVKFISK